MKWITDLYSIQGKTIKLLDKNIEGNLFYLGLGNDFFDIIQKHNPQKKKNDKLDVIKIKTFFSSKGVIKKMGGQAEWLG